MIDRTIGWKILIAGILLAWGFAGGTAASAPPSVFVVHCEPTTARSDMWLELVDLVGLADSHAVPLTILFTAQWAEMILADEARLATLGNWLTEGHEIGCHHHGYWAVKDRGAAWDGYTNTPLDDLDPADRALYRGTMDDYAALLSALPGERLTGCLGTDERDDSDWLCGLTYSTSGYAMSDAIGAPRTVERTGCRALEIGHGLLLGQARGAWEAAYRHCIAGEILGINAHVYNFAEFPAAFRAWFSFLCGEDPEGYSRFTVSGLLGSRGTP